MNRTNTQHVSFLLYCRGSLLWEPVFKNYSNNRVIQEWSCPVYFRFQENTLRVLIKFVKRGAIRQKYCRRFGPSMNQQRTARLGNCYQSELSCMWLFN